MTFIEGKWYLNYVVAKSTAKGLTALNREHIRCSLSTVFFMCNHLPVLSGPDGWRIPSGMAALSCRPVNLCLSGPFFVRIFDRMRKGLNIINERLIYV